MISEVGNQVGVLVKNRVQFEYSVEGVLDSEDFWIDRLRVLLAVRAQLCIQLGCMGYSTYVEDHKFSREWTIGMRPRVQPEFEPMKWIRSSEPQMGENSLHGKDHQEGWSKQILNSLERSRQAEVLVRRSSHTKDFVCACRSMYGY